MFALLVILAAMQFGGRAGTSAVDRAAARQTPATWYGLKPETVCLHPVVPQLPYNGESLTYGRPFLTFDSQASQVSLWNPETGGVTTVPGSDVAIVHVNGLAAACPSVK